MFTNVRAHETRVFCASMSGSSRPAAAAWPISAVRFIIVHQVVEPEFSRLVDVSALTEHGLDLVVEANAAERAALCRRFDLADLRSLTGKVHIAPGRTPSGTATIRVTGSLTADLAQTCVVTLEPFDVQVTEDFSLTFVRAGEEASKDVALSPFDDEAPEPLEGDEIDVGEVVAEHLALALDPWPRRPDAPLVHLEFPAGGQAEDSPNNPFAALGQLKSKM